ncbi:MAG: hypothetical protein FP811_11110 [Desulfobacteraceae bacterium]|nr:hypothetical protein [Desulfobacteraceae bacterium]
MSKKKHDQYQYLIDSLDLIDRNCKRFHDGDYASYRVVANQLRILLCDSNRGKDNSLAPRVVDDLRLHPLRTNLTDEYISKKAEAIKKDHPDVGPVLSWEPYTITGIPIQKKIQNLFDLGSNLIPLNEWLNQYVVILGGKRFSLREIIRSVSDRGGGSHVDMSPGEYLSESYKSHHKGDGRRATSHHEPMVVAIGEYIVSEFKNKLNEGIKD